MVDDILDLNSRDCNYSDGAQGADKLSQPSGLVSSGIGVEYVNYLKKENESLKRRGVR